MNTFRFHLNVLLPKHNFNIDSIDHVLTFINPIVVFKSVVIILGIYNQFSFYAMFLRCY